MRKLPVPVLLFLFAVPPSMSVVAQTSAKPEDPTGWSKARWGMTRAEVEKAFEGQTQELKPGDRPFLTRPKLVILAQKIGVAYYTVEFTFGAFQRLSKVTLKPNVAEGTLLRPLRDDLARLLSEKYGTPASDSSSKMVPPLETVWLLPRTQITLSLVKVGEGGDLTLTYAEREKESNVL